MTKTPPPDRYQPPDLGFLGRLAAAGVDIVGDLPATTRCPSLPRGGVRCHRAAAPHVCGRTLVDARDGCPHPPVDPGHRAGADPRLVRADGGAGGDHPPPLVADAAIRRPRGGVERRFTDAGGSRSRVTRGTAHHLRLQRAVASRGGLQCGAPPARSPVPRASHHFAREQITMRVAVESCASQRPRTTSP